MDMQGKRPLAITQQQAWDALNDPDTLKLCIPGCDRIEASGDNQYAVGVSVKVGPLAAKFSGKIALSDIVPPASYTIGFEGQGGPAGFGKGTAKVQLAPLPKGCELSYTVQASVGGKVAQLGQRLVDGAAKSMAEDFFKRFDDEMQKRFPEAYAEQAAAVGAVAAPAGGGVPTWVWAAAAVAAAVVAYLVLR